MRKINRMELSTSRMILEVPERDAPGKLESKRKVGGKLGEEEPAMGPPLSVPLPLKYDISEAAGAPKEVEKKWQPVGSQSRGSQGTGESELSRRG